MDFSINFSPPAAKLLEEGCIEIDRFKCPDWSDLVATARLYRPVMIHFDLHVGKGNLWKTDWKKVAEWIDHTDTPFVNLHLSPSVKNFPGFPLHSNDPVILQEIASQVIAELSTVTQIFGPERVIIENIPYRPERLKFLRAAAEPAFICQVVEGSGCGFLLDISHARIAARAIGMDELDYMSHLPVNSLRELHFTGLHNLDGFLQDHLSVLENDWPVLDWVLDKIRNREWAFPWMLAFEYGGVGEIFDWRSDPQVIQDQVPRLYSMVKTFK